MPRRFLIAPEAARLHTAGKRHHCPSRFPWRMGRASSQAVTACSVHAPFYSKAAHEALPPVRLADSARAADPMTLLSDRAIPRL